MVVRPISATIVKQLNKKGLGEPIHFVGLGANDFQFAFSEFRVSSTYRAEFKIDGKSFDWTEGPIDAPVWKLVGQQVVNVTNNADKALRFALSHGDEIEIWTDDSSYEALLIEAANLQILEVF
jgi:hypothetical protein